MKRARLRTRLAPESLEHRIAPAAVVRFTEVDGDRVTVKTNKGTSEQLNTAIGGLQGATNVDGITIDLILNATLASAFAGTNLTITAAGGSGPSANRANGVRINAFNSDDANSIDLHNVVVKGNIVWIDAGDRDLATPAINKLIVTDFVPIMGPFGSFDAVASEIHGDITSISIKGSFHGFIISVDAAGAPNFQSDDGTRIGSFRVGGDIAYLQGDDVGHLQVNGITRLTVRGTFFGPLSPEPNCGLIEARWIRTISIHEMTSGARIVLS